MSDFTNGFWPIFISVVVLGGIAGCLAVLFITSKSHDPAHTGQSTGHVYDEDIVEMNNPMPRWWMWMFILTCVFGLAYLALYPGLTTYSGKLGWTQIKQYEQEVKESNDKIAPIYAQYTAMATEEVAKDAKAMAIGERLFMNTCAQCHGSDAHGSRGFPNLTDNDWLGAGTPEYIKETITNGRQGMMPPMAAAVGDATEVKNVAHYVLSLSGSQHDANSAAAGKEKFAACAACHGAEGKGNPAMGAPNLTDNIWLHGAGEAAIIDRINHGKTSQMPAQASRLTPEQIHVLTAYVWGLSNGGAKQ
ncbi:MAG: cytochrome-c oxidase, cbb3-type subunit III [Betaproteobacteria bacterium]|nr:cytochrome-c oxidase, cbb3-type subunit III [Betaproteobacteria bacterium]